MLRAQLNSERMAGLAYGAATLRILDDPNLPKSLCAWQWIGRWWRISLCVTIGLKLPPSLALLGRLCGRGGNLPTHKKLSTMWPKRADCKLRVGPLLDDSWKLAEVAQAVVAVAGFNGDSDDASA